MDGPRLRLRIDRCGAMTELSDFRDEIHMVGLAIFAFSFSPAAAGGEKRICRVGVPRKNDYASLWVVSGVPFPLCAPMYPTGTVFDLPLAAADFSKDAFPFRKDAAFEFVTRVTSHLKLNTVASISAIRMLNFKKEAAEEGEEDDEEEGEGGHLEEESGDEEVDGEAEDDEDEEQQEEEEEDEEDEEGGEEEEEEEEGGEEGEEGEEDEEEEGEEEEEEGIDDLEEQDEEGDGCESDRE